MRWALAGFTAIKTKAASQPVLPSPRSLQEKSSVRVGHRETDWHGVLFVTMWITTLSFAHVQAHPIWTSRSMQPSSKETVSTSLKGPWKFEVFYLTAAKVICLHENGVVMKCVTFAGQDCQRAIKNSRDLFTIYSATGQALQEPH